MQNSSVNCPSRWTLKRVPVTEEVAKVREARVEEMRAILDGRDSRLMLIIGPCSADREDSVMDYVCRLVPCRKRSRIRS